AAPADSPSAEAVLDASEAAYAAVPALLSSGSPARPWVALYSFDRVPVLNAQLQAALSLGDYAELTGDPDAQAFADRLTASAQTLLPSFDTGYWSRYALHGDDWPLHYHDYVIALLRKLAARTGDASWSEAADRFTDSESEPPVLRVGPLPKTLKRHRKTPIRFWLSKLSTVTLRVGRTAVSETVGHGSHTFVWEPRNA